MEKVFLKGMVAVLIFILHSSLPALADSTSITVNCSAIDEAINENIWSVGAPDKYSWWPGNQNLSAQIKNANIKLVRVGPVQLGNYNAHDIYPSAGNWNWTDLDAILNTIWNAGAMPLFIVCAYPGGVPEKDWEAYADFMEGIVKRYNVDRSLGDSKTIKYWEMWNEPTIEGDGTLTKEEYQQFVLTVGARMKETDASIKLIGPADAWSDFSDDGFISYVAGNLSDYIDILSWHDYGPDPEQSNEVRMAWTDIHYNENFITGQATFDGFGMAITEYNISHADGGAEYNKKYHNEFAACYMASAIINAINSGAEIFSVYTLAESGQNLLGLLKNTNYEPYKPYFTFYLFGNYTGHKKIQSGGGNAAIDFIASKDTISDSYFLTVVNKNSSGESFDLSVNLEEIQFTSGTVLIRILDAANNPTNIQKAISYSDSKFAYNLAAYSVVNFEIIPGLVNDLNTRNTSLTSLAIFPNPIFDNQLNLRIEAQETSRNQIIIYSISGEKVYENVQRTNITGMLDLDIDLSYLPSGTYLLNIINTNSTISKIVIKR